MSGHSKWASIKHKKGAADVKRGKIFTKLIREITVAAKNGGGDPEGNPRLRLAILKAKAENMPKDNIEKAIKKGTGELEGVSYEEVSYEGYGPGGSAVLVLAMTDNKNRTVAVIRNLFSKLGGNMGAAGCVSFLFERKGLIVVDKKNTTEEKLMEIALESGAEDVKDSGDSFEVISSIEDFENIKKGITTANIKMESADITMIPKTSVSLNEKDGKQMLRLMDALDDCDDVQDFYTNADISDEIMNAM